MLPNTRAHLIPFVPRSTMHTHMHNPAPQVLFFPTHVPQCTRFYLLTNSTSVFQGSEHKEIYALKKNHSVCKNALEKERERVYTHWSREYGNGFCSFVSERYNQILPYSYDFFFGGEGAYHFLILIKTTTPSNFLVFFNYIHIFFTKNRHCKNHKGKKSFSHTHTRSLNRSRLVCPAPYIAGIRPPYGYRCCSGMASVAARHCSGRGEEIDIPGQ